MLEEEKDDVFFSNPADSPVSVIIPTINSAKTLHQCLESIRLQRHKNIEIIVVDAYSLDNTTQIASNFNAKIYLAAGERTAAKNLGILKSTGAFLFFVDSDMILDAGVISECVSICSYDPNIAGVIVPERSIGRSFWVRVRDFEKALYIGSKIESARFFRKSFVAQVGGFEEDIVFYEESTLHQKLEMRGLTVDKRASSFIFHNEEEFNLTKWLRKKQYYSRNAALYASKFPNYAKIQTKVSYRIRIFTSNSNWKKLIQHPVLSVGLFVLKSLEFLVSRI